MIKTGLLCCNCHLLQLCLEAFFLLKTDWEDPPRMIQPDCFEDTARQGSWKQWWGGDKVYWVPPLPHPGPQPLLQNKLGRQSGAHGVRLGHVYSEIHVQKTGRMEIWGTVLSLHLRLGLTLHAFLSAGHPKQSNSLVLLTVLLKENQ